MDSTALKRKIFTLIKITSTVLITGALGLEAWNLYALLTDFQLPGFLNLILGLERVAVAIHLVEGLVAAAFAPSRNQASLSYGVYTFFVGTVGLLELFEQKGDIASRPEIEISGEG